MPYLNKNYQKEWRERNKDKIKQYTEDHKEDFKLYLRKNVNKVNSGMAGWRGRNPEKVRGYRLRRHGISVEQYDEIHTTQNGLCAICKRPETRIYKGSLSRLAVDHCHVTGKNRGLLCWRCNSCIGRLEDSPDLLRAAADYIEKHKQL